jgi:hypothetical protein
MKVIKDIINGNEVIFVQIGKNFCWFSEINGDKYGAELINKEGELSKSSHTSLWQNAEDTINKINESNITV